MNVSCPPDSELERLLANRLGAADEHTLEAHVMSCQACQQRLDELTHGSMAKDLPRARVNDKSGSSRRAAEYWQSYPIRRNRLGRWCQRMAAEKDRGGQRKVVRSADCQPGGLRHVFFAGMCGRGP